uniref:T-cell receptor beta chain C region n=1 Tax=Monopterus albus TaxID=43700 RepID=UPI003D7E7EE9
DCTVYWKELLVKKSQCSKKVKVHQSCTAGLWKFFTCQLSVCSNTYPAYFGEGTKLTVLETGHELKAPEVKVLRPSRKERRKKGDGKKKTLVCVASKFYPDHVSVSWKKNNVDVTKGVATDAAALRNGTYYIITSRLNVSAEDWDNPDNTFTCTVSFFDGNTTIYTSDHIRGEKAKENSITRVKYLRITQNAKLSYAVLIVKSCIYGAFVAFLVWKLQGSAGKQNN